MYGCISLSFLPKKELQIAEREKKTYFAYLCHCKYFWIFLQEHRNPHGDVGGGLMPRIHVHDEDVNDVDAGCRNGCADGDRQRSRIRGDHERDVARGNSTSHARENELDHTENGVAKRCVMPA